jgi:C4-dicarboxylate-specific signal transduction histidine kinase
MTKEDEMIAQIAHLDRLASSSLLASGLAHEIANPLVCLVTALDWLHERIGRLRRVGGAHAHDVDQLVPDLELARVSAQTMTSLVRDFQLFLRPSEITPVIGNVELRPAIDRAVRMARAQLAAVTPLEVELSDAPAVRIPATRVTQIVLNLLLNASEALSDRPWSANLVSVTLKSVEGNAVIEVRDNGPGLSPDVLRNMFEPGRSTKPGGTSLGLGLAICNELVRTSGGRMSVICPPPSGTIFRVVFPPAERPR